GELARFTALHSVLSNVYTGLAISLPPEADEALARDLAALPGVTVLVTADWSHGRHEALRAALAFEMGHVHSADFDRLLRWVETRPDEWRATVAAMLRADCLVVGRTPRAYATHPQALVQTEAISNAVFSHLLGQPLDLSAGSKGFSRAAAEVILRHSEPGCALGMDAAWPVLLQRAGFRIEAVLVEGLDWESADRWLDRAADDDAQRQAAETYDADPAHWARRVAVALEIVQSGLAAWGEARDQRP
ncbi:MAG: hypothetical protein JW910_17235, partial [Anaerolineae bacterium]|nr:hypothetical protein [Anaerolineae bacterium]